MMNEKSSPKTLRPVWIRLYNIPEIVKIENRLMSAKDWVVGMEVDMVIKGQRGNPHSDETVVYLTVIVDTQTIKLYRTSKCIHTNTSEYK